MKKEILEELNQVLDEKTIAIFSVTMTRKEDGDILPTITVFGIDKSTYETRLKLSNAVMELAQRMRERE
jgi:hypothetical protein